MEDQIRLRWTSHQGTILSVFDALLASESLVDVTLACEGQYLRAHKIILSACSPYFQELLNVDLTKHPIFFLKDVQYTQLQALILYMYRGEVNIAREDLPSLLQVAQALKIRGLADVETTSNSISSDTIILPDLRQKPAPTLVSSTLPAPMPMSPTSNVPFPATSFQQTHSFTQSNVNSSSATSSPIISAVPSSAPPAAKKTRIETPTRPFAQTAEAQKLTLSQRGNPRIVVHRLSLPQSDPVQTASSSSSIRASDYESAGFSNSEYENQDYIQQPQTYGRVKLEEDHGNFEVEVDAAEEEEGENSMSQSGFSDSWQLGEGDTSGKVEDDDEVPGGSGVTGTNQRRVTANGAEGGGRDLGSEIELPFHNSGSDSWGQSDHQNQEDTRNPRGTGNPKKKRIRRKEAQPLEWKRMKNMKLRMYGKEYFGFQKQVGEGDSKVDGRGSSSKSLQIARKKAKAVGPRCNSVFCQTHPIFQCPIISDAARNVAFQIFWNKEWRQKKIYISSLVDIVDIKRKTTETESRRKSTYIYHLMDDNQKPVRVCRKMFLSTFDITEKQVRNWRATIS